MKFLITTLFAFTLSIVGFHAAAHCGTCGVGEKAECKKDDADCKKKKAEHEAAHKAGSKHEHKDKAKAAAGQSAGSDEAKKDAPQPAAAPADASGAKSK